MASSLASTSASPPSAAAATNATRLSHSPNSNLSFRLSPKPNSLRFFTKGCPPSHMVLCPRVKAQLNEVSLDGSSNAAPPVKANSDVEPPTKPSTEPSSSVLATQESVSQFITQVARLVKLVDSRDIVELKMKQQDCEVTIRKKEAMPQLQSAPQHAVVYSPPSQMVAPVAPASTPKPTPAPPTPSPSASPPAVKSAKSSHPPLKSPMAGTLYRSPGPGEPPFVKVGDKVKKGQVLCIIEAMKLMNEIEVHAMDMSDAVIVKSSRLKSVVWNDFDRIKKGDTCVAVCRHCKKKLSGSSTSGTSHLRNHLIRCQRRSGHGIAQYITAREKRKEGTLAIANFSLDQDPNKDDTLSLVNIKFEQTQLKDDSVNPGTSNFDQRRSRFDLARMIILHGYPLAMVEHVGFRAFVKNLQPLFELVTLNRVEADCIEIYEKERKKMNEMLDKLPGKISLSADVWTAMGDTEYLCLTSNYIDESWQLRRRILNFIRIDPSHTEDTLSEAIMTCLMDWDIDRKLFSMILDSCSTCDNIATRIGERLLQNRFLYCNGQLFDIRCAANVLNVMVQHALGAVSEIFNKIRETIRYIKSSQTVLAKFNEMAKEVGIMTQKCLFLDNPLQWNSTYSMLEVTLEFKDVFILLQENDTAFKIYLSEVEWERVTAVASYLKLFVEVINVFTKSKYPTANIYFPELCDVKLHLIEWCKNSDECIGPLALKLRSKFDEYWEKCSLGLAVAAMLDPRFKMKLVDYYYPQIYGSTSAGRIEEVFDGVKALYNEHSLGFPLASHDQGLAWQVGSGNAPLCLPCPAKDSRDRLMGFDKFLHETSQGEGAKSDLDKYLEEPLFPRNVDFNILNWWRVHTPRYPVLSMMARNVLGIPMSKVAPELAFNYSGRVLDRDWSSLNPATVQALVCSQDWIRSELEN